MASPAIIYLQIATGAGLIIFWILFFTVGLAPENAPESYEAFEHSFPVPDIILAATLIASSVLLLMKNPLGMTLSIASGGALIFLGMLDISFNLQNMFARQSLKEKLFSATINLWCVGFGLAILISA